MLDYSRDFFCQSMAGEMYGKQAIFVNPNIVRN